MRSVDAAWLQMDRPENAADIVALLSLDGPVAFERLRAVVEERLVPFGHFCHRAVADRLGGAAWEPDADFALGRHLERVRLPSAGPSLRDFVGEVATRPLDPVRPLWRVWAVEGPGERSAVVAKIHHCIGDGFALVSVLLSLADDREGAEGPLPFPALPLPDLSRDAVRAALRDLPRALALARHGAGMAGALARMIALPRDPPSPLHRPLSGRRRAAWSRGFPLPRLRQAARARRATVNDLLMAALAGALRDHLAAEGVAVDGLRLRALVPVNLRVRAPDGLGNGFGLVFLELPVDLAAPADRLQAVRERMAALKAGPEAAVTYGVLSALGRLPAAAEGLVNAFFAAKASLVVTNVPGPREPLRLAGQGVDHLMFWVPHPSRLGLGVSVLTYAGEARVGARADQAVMEDPAALVERIERELADLGAGSGEVSPGSTASRPAAP